MVNSPPITYLRLIHRFSDLPRRHLSGTDITNIGMLSWKLGSYSSDELTSLSPNPL